MYMVLYQNSNNGNLMVDSFIDLSDAEYEVNEKNEDDSYENIRLVRDVDESDRVSADYKALYQQLYDDFVKPKIYEQLSQEPEKITEIRLK